jgi:O-antigen/teichoic acid export membrane protein
LKSPGRGLAGSAFVYTISNAANAALPLLLLPLLTRILTPAEYGTVALFSSLLVILGAFVGANAHAAIIVRYFQLERQEMRNYVSSVIWIGIASVPVVLLIVLGLHETITALTGIALHWLLIAVSVSFAQFLIQILLALWQAEGRPLPYSAFRFSHAVLDSTITLTLLLLFGLTLTGRLAGISAASLLSLLLAILILWRMGWLSRRPQLCHQKDAIRFGAPLIPHVVGSMLIFAADRFLIGEALGMSATGNYVVSMQVAMALGLVADAINKAFSPWLLEKLNETNFTRDQMIVKRTYIYFVAWILIALIFSYILPYNIQKLAGPNFYIKEDIVFYHCLGVSFVAMYYMVANYVFFAANTASLATITITCGLTNVCLTYFLVRSNGAVGAAQSFMISQMLLFLATWMLAQRSRPMPWLGGGARK